jgi:branched-chain amino acid transport system substrate-binding protein
MFGTLARIARGCGATFVALALGIVPLAGSAADPFEINVIVPLTGAGAFLGKEEAESLSLVERNVNAVGGVRGRPIKFIVADDESNPQVAVQLTNRLLAKNVPIILGGTLLASCLAMAPLVKNGPVLYCLSPGIDPQPGSNIFSTFLLTIDLLRPSIKYLRAKGGSADRRLDTDRCHGARCRPRNRYDRARK